MKTTSDTLRLLGSFISVLMTVAAVTGCEPSPLIAFENQHDQEVKILQAHVRDDGSIDGFVEQATIPAHATKKILITFLGSDWVNRLQAVDTSGKIVFSQDYNVADLEKTGWKITIPP